MARGVYSHVYVITAQKRACVGHRSVPSGSWVSWRGLQPRGGWGDARTPDTITLRKICMSKWKNQDPWGVHPLDLPLATILLSEYAIRRMPKKLPRPRPRLLYAPQGVDLGGDSPSLEREWNTERPCTKWIIVKRFWYDVVSVERHYKKYECLTERDFQVRMGHFCPEILHHFSTKTHKCALWIMGNTN